MEQLQGMSVMNKPIRGFTLVELMIVVAIIALIIAFGYPSYRNQVMKTNRSDGMIFLLDIADRQERFYSDSGTYTTDITDLGFANATSPDGHYTVAITDDPSSDITITYQITATPQGKQADDTCSSYTIDSLGTRTSSPASCWD
jgi:type IV pilus assembly protein PilE